MRMECDKAKDIISKTGCDFYNRGWMYGTSGNLSARVEDGPYGLRFAITASGVDKGTLSPEDILIFSPNNPAPPKQGLRPSAETSIHTAVYEARADAGAVLHVHTPESTVYSMASTLTGTPAMFPITGYEMIKGLGVWEENAEVHIPVFENHGIVPTIAGEINQYLNSNPDALPVFLIRGHGLTAWGKNVVEAKHRLEIGHFLSTCELIRSKHPA